MILDTSFLIDLEREQLRRSPGKATSFLRENAQRALAINFTIAGELASGLPPERQDYWKAVIGRFRFIDYSSDVGWSYGRIHQALRRQGKPIGANDLWIAATAVAHRLPVVTKNSEEFRRVEGLEVIDY